MVKLLMAMVEFLEPNLSVLQEFNHTFREILGFSLSFVT